MMEERRGYEGRDLLRRAAGGGGVRKDFSGCLSQPLQAPDRLTGATPTPEGQQAVTNHYVALVERE